MSGRTATSMQHRYYKTNHRKYNLKVHIVLVTKYRKALLQHGIDHFVKCAVYYLAKQYHLEIIAAQG